MDAREVLSEVDCIFILVVFKVVPQAMIEGDRVRFLLIWWREYKEVVSLFVSRITGRDSSDPGVSCLS